MKISSKLMTKVISKLVRMAVRNKLGYDIDIQLNELTATIIDGTAHVHLNADAEMNKDEFLKVIKNNAGL